MLVGTELLVNSSCQRNRPILGSCCPWLFSTCSLYSPLGVTGAAEEPAGGEFRFVPENEAAQAGDTQTLAPATEQQAAEGVTSGQLGEQPGGKITLLFGDVEICTGSRQPVHLTLQLVLYGAVSLRFFC